LTVAYHMRLARTPLKKLDKNPLMLLTNQQMCVIFKQS
jgi:hypothetical protein